MNRRAFVTRGAGFAAATLASAVGIRSAWTQASYVMVSPAVRKQIETQTLSIGYEENGSSSGFPVILLHGFPDDVRAYSEISPVLAKAGYRILVPYLRGYGPTRFREPSAPRMAEQAAISQDLIDFADALQIARFAVVGYDWGGRAASVTCALHPDRVRAAVLVGGNTIQNTVSPPPPGDPEGERALWYQWYFNTERGRAGLTANRRGICRLLWETWSPGWHFTDETFNRTAASFDNPDFVDLVIHSYRHRLGSMPGDPHFLATEKRLAEDPKIHVPTIVLYGANDGVRKLPPASVDQALCTSLVSREVVSGAGHFLVREKPEAVSSAMLKLLSNVR
jgi:pimeloyl-ACP methyl ester carboxylesterase